jgi:lipid-binding SYLF domain-containing protein
VCNSRARASPAAAGTPARGAVSRRHVLRGPARLGYAAVVTQMERVGRVRVLAALVLTVLLLHARTGLAASAKELDRDARAALSKLTSTQASARTLAQKARSILVFPSIVKAGFMFGGQMGEGVLYRGGKAQGYYNTVAASYGLQAGIQKYGYALFFMNDAALKQLESLEGFELGVGPSLVVVDEGKGKSITSNTITSDIYAFIFSQKGLMGGLGIQGSKITKIDKK